MKIPLNIRSSCVQAFHFGILAQFFLENLIKNRPRLVCAKSIFTLILNVSDKFIEKCRRSRLFGEWHLGKMGFWDMAFLVYFWSIFSWKFRNRFRIEKNPYCGKRIFDLGLQKILAAKFRSLRAQTLKLRNLADNFFWRPKSAYHNKVFFLF